VAQSLRNRFIEVDDLVGFPANDFSSPKRDYFSNMTNRSKRGPHNRLGFAIQPDYLGDETPPRLSSQVLPFADAISIISILL
jgi:hypothetical protein